MKYLIAKNKRKQNSADNSTPLSISNFLKFCLLAMHHINNNNCILGRKESHWRLPWYIRAAFTLIYATSVTDSRLKTEQNNGMEVWKTNLTVETHIGDANWEWPFFHFNMSNKRCLSCGVQFFLWQTQTQFQWEKNNSEWNGKIQLSVRIWPKWAFFWRCVDATKIYESFCC